MVAATASVRDLRRARRHNRLADFDIVEAVYQAYVTVLAGAVGASYAVEAIGDKPLTPSALADVSRWGPPLLGLALAAAFAWALRSGASGGPLVIEAADVRHLLLAPIDRGSALRPVAVARFRVAASRGAVVGGIVGLVAAQRLPGDTWGWVLAAGVTMGAVAVAANAIALLVSGRRFSARAASGAALGALAAALADVVRPSLPAPFAPIGEIMLWPMGAPTAPGVCALAGLVAVLPVLALAFVGGVSLERAERRAGLVTQLRFATVMRDLRAVILLRRQLAQERSRVRPWVRLPRGRGRAGAGPKRDLHGVLRWPFARVARVAVLAAGTGVAGLAAASGTTEAVLVAGFLAWLVALDATEGLAQLVDRPDLRAMAGPSARALVFAHLVVAVVVAGGAAAIGVAAVLAVAADPTSAGRVATVVAFPAALCSVAAAAVSVVRGPPAMFDIRQLLLPPAEVGGAMFVREALPPALATVGFLPVLVAQDGIVEFREVAVAATAALVVPAAVAVWLATRGHAQL